MIDVCILLTLTLLVGLVNWRRFTLADWTKYLAVFCLGVGPTVALMTGSYMAQINKPLAVSVAELPVQQNLQLAATLAREDRVEHRELATPVIETRTALYQVQHSRVLGIVDQWEVVERVLVLPLED